MGRMPTGCWTRSVVVLPALIAFGTIAWPAPESTPPSFSNDVVPLLEQRCAFCHNTEDPQGALVLERDMAWQMLVNVPSTQARMQRVAPGAPDQSYLLLKLLGTHQDAGRGTRMPPSWLPLPSAEVVIIRRWIEAGAHAD